MRTYLYSHPECLLTLSPFSRCQINPLWLFWTTPSPFFPCQAFFIPFFPLVLIKLAKKKACLVQAQGAPRLSCGKGTVTVNRGRSYPWREDTHIQHSHTKTHTHRSESGSIFRWCQRRHMNRACVEELGKQWEPWWDCDGGERERGIAQGDMMLSGLFPGLPCWSMKRSRSFTPQWKKSHHTHSSTWMLFGLMDSGLTQ